MLRVTQGSKNGPQVFGRGSAMLGRFSQGVLGEREARLNIYTDDPICSIVSSQRRGDMVIVMLVLIWRALGFRLAYAKAQHGSAVEWVGHSISATAAWVEAAIKA